MIINTILYFFTHGKVHVSVVGIPYTAEINNRFWNIFVTVKRILYENLYAFTVICEHNILYTQRTKSYVRKS